MIEAATEAGLKLVPPEDVAEVPGKGIEGTIGGRRIAMAVRRTLAVAAAAISALWQLRFRPQH